MHKKKELSLKNQKYDELNERGLSMSGSNEKITGNAMYVAQRACFYWKKNEDDEHYKERGLCLIEHWRCFPEIYRILQSISLR